MKAIQSLARQPRLVSVLIGLVVFAVVVGFWRTGAFQSLECAVYDAVLRHRPTTPGTSARVVLVGVTEADIRQYGWALDDRMLARALERIAAQGPSAIGLDLYRDLPEPRSGEYSAELTQVLRQRTNIVGIFLSEGANAAAIDPPPALGDNPDQISFNDLPADRDGNTVRRTLLFPFPSTNEPPVYSLAFQLVRHHLRRHGMPVNCDPAAPDRLRLGRTDLHAFQPSDGPYIHDDNITGFQMLLDFRAPKPITYSLSNVLTGAIPAGAFQDRIVLVGIMASSVNDFVQTPLGAGQFGVLLHAQAADQLLRLSDGSTRPAQFWPETGESVWIALWSLLGAALGYYVRVPWRFLALLPLVLLALAGGHVTALRFDWWLPLAPPASAFATSAVAVMSYLSHQEKLMRSVLMTLFSRHVSPDIAATIWSRRDEFLDGNLPRAQKLMVTVLFTDLKGFSTISEKMDPPQLYSWLSRYLGEMADCVHQHGGVLNKFTGDGLLAVFGVPTPRTTPAEHAHDAARAVRCALSMGRRLVELHQEWERIGQPRVSMRVGIYTGEVAAGALGSSERHEYAVIGDVVNTASRLESYDKSLANPDDHPLRCRILIGRPTEELVRGRFECAEVGLLKVKGKENAVAVYQVHNERASDAGPS